MGNQAFSLLSSSSLCAVFLFPIDLVLSCKCRIKRRLNVVACIRKDKMRTEIFSVNLIVFFLLYFYANCAGLQGKPFYLPIESLIIISVFMNQIDNETEINCLPERCASGCTRIWKATRMSDRLVLTIVDRWRA